MKGSGYLAHIAIFLFAAIKNNTILHHLPHTFHKQAKSYRHQRNGRFPTFLKWAPGKPSPMPSQSLTHKLSRSSALLIRIIQLISKFSVRIL